MEAKMEELVIEDVLDTETAKTFTVKALIDKVDNKVEIVAASNPLRVVGEDGSNVGFATIYMERNMLVADLVINYSSPERLLIETGEKIYASADKFIERDPSRAYPVYHITAIELVRHPPAHEIPIGKPII